MTMPQIEYAGGYTLDHANASRRGIMERAPAWWRRLAARGVSAPADATVAPTRSKTRPPVAGWLVGTCCPGVSKPCHGHVDGRTLPEQFTADAWRSMLEQIRAGDLEVPLRLGHDGPTLATTRGLDLVFSNDPVHGLEFEARLRDTKACRNVLQRIGSTGWGVSIGFKRGRQWTVERDGIGTVRVIDDAVLDHVAIIDGTGNRRAAYPAARCYAAKDSGVASPRSLQAKAHDWAFRVLAIQAGAKR